MTPTDPLFTHLLCLLTGVIIGVWLMGSILFRALSRRNDG
jgi:uncharacterized protein YneF (UPF0154 family)